MKNTHMHSGHAPTNIMDVILGISGRISMRWLIALIFLLQLAVCFQGLDMSDEGFLSTLYSQIFRDPASVTYPMLFWLTGVIGGTFELILGDSGLIGLRIMGAVVNTLTAVLIIQSLKRHLDRPVLNLSAILLVLNLNNDLKIFNYNTLSALVFVCAAILIAKGLKGNRHWLVFFAGALLAANALIRIPNLLQAGIVVIFFGYAWLVKNSGTNPFRLSISFAAGYLISLSILFAAMKLLGHWDIYRESLSYLSKISDENVLDAGEKKIYGITYILNEFRIGVTKPLLFAFAAIVLLSLIVYLYSFVAKKTTRQQHLANSLATAFLATITILLMIRGSITTYALVFLMTGLSMILYIPYMRGNHTNEQKLLYSIGLFFLLSYPIGSASGIYTAGRFCLWLAFPFAVDYMAGISSLRFHFKVSGRVDNIQKKIEWPEKYCRNTAGLAIVLLITMGIYFYDHYPFFDWHKRTEMTSSIRHDKLKHIYTTPGRAAQINELLAACRTHTKPGDQVLAYAHIALLYYCTDTRPFIHNPLPAVYRASLFQKDINNSLEKSASYPTVIRQKKPTTSVSSTWPEKNIGENYTDLEEFRGINKVLQTFLDEHAYVSVWSNDYFEILKSTKKMVSH